MTIASRSAANGRRPRAGFTMLEIVLALGILLLGMSSILALFSFGAALSKTASVRAEASGAVSAIVADLEETLFPMLEDGRAGEPPAVRNRPVPGHPRLTYSADPQPVEGGLLARDGLPLTYRVTVRVHWSAQGSVRSLDFETLLLREIPFDERMRRRNDEATP